MSEARKKLEAFTKAKKELCDLFGIEGYYEVCDYTDARWIVLGENSGTYMSWVQKDCEYSFDYVSKIDDNEVEDLVMFYVQENGDKFYAIMDKSKEMTEEQAEEAGVL